MKINEQAEVNALIAYPVLIDPESKYTGEKADLNRINRDRYIEGYMQAVKDCRLTKEDVKKIVEFHEKITDNPYFSYESLLGDVVEAFEDWKKRG